MEHHYRVYLALQTDALKMKWLGIFRAFLKDSELNEDAPQIPNPYHFPCKLVDFCSSRNLFAEECDVFCCCDL